MQDAQTPLNSGFGFHSTAAEVVAGIDLTGKLAIITGGHGGLGLETTKALTGAGAHVLVLARNLEAARKALEGVNKVEIDQLDLADQASVRTCAERFVASGCKVDIVICNAAVMANDETRVDDGWESQFGTNHLGHYALVNLLWPAIAPGARVVSLSSRGLAKTMAGTGVTVNAVLPGPTLSEGVEDMLKAETERTGKSIAEIGTQVLKTLRPSSITKRFQTSQEVANLVVYTCSPLSSGTTGAALRADGGVADTPI